MTIRRQLENHRHSLDEIRNIMNSMKTLAYMETRKLAQFLSSQAAVVKSIESAAADLLEHFPNAIPAAPLSKSIVLLLGTERGFCGDFNQKIANSLDSCNLNQAVSDPIVVCIGRKLPLHMPTDIAIKLTLSGASVVEDVTNLITILVSELLKLQKEHDAHHVFCVHHDNADHIHCTRVLPPFAMVKDKKQQNSYPPDINLPQMKLMAELIEHYLFAALHEIIYTSLMAENYSRVSHLENAVKHLDDQSSTLARKCNSLRQEEITEEIEVILLSTGQFPSNVTSPAKQRQK